jgi:hypothetical protein
MEARKADLPDEAALEGPGTAFVGKERSGAGMNGGLLHTFDALNPQKAQSAALCSSTPVRQRSSTEGSATAMAPNGSAADTPDIEKPAPFEVRIMQTANAPRLPSQMEMPPAKRTSKRPEVPNIVRVMSSRETYPSTRSIGINTELSMPKNMPDDPSGLVWRPLLEQLSAVQKSSLLAALQQDQLHQEEASKVGSCCGKSKDQADAQPSLDFDARVPAFSTFYGRPSVPAQPNLQPSPLTPAEGLLAIDHFVNEAQQLEPAFWQGLFDVPGCSLPGVACQCGDGCTCAGCQTHVNNGMQVAAADLERMDFVHDKPPREHPSWCCDTRIQHEQSIARLTSPPMPVPP